MRVKPLVVATAAVLGLLAGCSGAEPAPAPSSAAPSPSSEASSAGPTTSPSPSSSAPGSDSAKVSTAEGKLTWVMPCAAPRDQDIEGNAEDLKTYVGFHAWACGQGAATRAGVIVAELKKEPADTDAARRQLVAAMKEVVPSGTPTENEFLGHPGVTQQVERDGRTTGYQGVSFGPYLALFFVVPADDLPTLTDTIAIG